MLQLRIPQPDQLLAKLLFNVKANPLARPKVNIWAKSIRQPLENQQELLHAVSQVEPYAISEPVHVQILINWPVPETKKKQGPHPIARHFGDIDNLAKAVNDAIVKAKVILDDKLIVGQTVTKAFGKEDVIAVCVWGVSPMTIEVDPWDSLFLSQSLPSYS
jgi:Holliday junction resolvase RusA-like endonuclease